MRIGLWLEEDAFEQDIRELLMAFYPGAVFVYGGRDETEGGAGKSAGERRAEKSRSGKGPEPGADRAKGAEDQTEQAGKVKEQARRADEGEALGLDLRVDGAFLDGRSRYRLQVERRQGRTAGGKAEDCGPPVSGAESGGPSVNGAGSSRPSVCGAESIGTAACVAEALAQGCPAWEQGFREALANEPFAVDPADRKETKDRIKGRLYFLLALDTGRLLPWGSITGIRPVKIVEGKLAEGWEEERIASYMEAHYLTGKEKRDLSLRIAKEERRLLRTLDFQKGYSLYVGIPFCPTTCLYCSFTSYPIARWRERLDEYLDILKKECQIVQAHMSGKKELQTIYIGGGTPTSLPEEQLDRLLDMVCEVFDFSGLREFTVEAGRPDSITREKLKLLKAHGVSRISINPQTMAQETLDLIGRQHTVGQVLEVFAMARDLGFDNINMDMILGLPGEGKEKVAHTLEEICRLRPESLTVHCLALKRAARLNLEKDRYKGLLLADGPALEELVELAAAAAGEMGMAPYYLYRQKNMAGNLENVGYAQGDKACLYNILMMEEKHTVAGCGAGTTTKVVIPGENRVERLENIKNIQEYLPRYQEVLEKKERFMQQYIR